LIAGSGYAISFAFVSLASAFVIGCASFEKGILLAPSLLGRLLGYLGSRSYGIYLIHEHFLRVLAAPTPIPKSWFGPFVSEALARDLVALLLSLGTAELCYRFLETKLIAYGRRITSSATPAADRFAVHVPKR